MSLDPNRPEWPLPHYARASHAHLQAVGVLISEFCDLETQLFEIFYRYCGLSNNLALALFHTFNSAQRISFLRILISENEPIEDIRELIDHYIKAFGIHAENRNFLAHAYIAVPKIGDEARAWKVSSDSPLRWNTVDIPVEKIRRAADSMHATKGFGLSIIVAKKARDHQVEKGELFPFPEKHVLPSKLNLPLPKAHKEPKRQPRPSGERR